MSKDYVLSLSYGKDSLACLGAIEQLGLPLTRIVHAEVWATDTIHADLPEMVDFKKKADAIIKDRWGIDVEHVRADVTYEEKFYKPLKWRSKIGCIYGFPLRRASWCNSQLKIRALNKCKVDGIRYIGIAFDEPSRFHVLTETKRSPLVEARWTEAMCRDWCERNGLLSPIYSRETRGGCWFCHNQTVDSLRRLRKEHPDLWALLLKWDTDSPVSFKPNGITVHDFDKRFELEDNGRVPTDRHFRWDMVKRKEQP